MTKAQQTVSEMPAEQWDYAFSLLCEIWSRRGMVDAAAKEMGLQFKQKELSLE